jgi:EAL domain-containing protein (putative c-di-GMP-specific phosphodiesterase class I)
MPETELTAFGLEILAAVGRAYSLDGIEVDPQPCVGIAAVPGGTADVGGDSGLDPSTLLQRAEMAMLAAKSKQESLQIYRSSMGEVYRRRFQLVTQFRQAVEQGRIIVHYQPKVNLAERELVGVEALVRWMHPEFGLVSPAEFVEAIEATGSIDILLGHVLDIVLQQLRDWTARGIRITAAVNLSVRNLLAENFAGMVADALQRHQVPAELLTFEITESSVMADPEHSLPVLRSLHGMGIGLSVDDFGTGYSSLAYLRRLPIDEIKIDRSFVQGMGTDLSDLAIVKAIVDLGHSLDLRVVAEGVEEEAARDALRDMDCDQAQGFLISRPMPLDRFEAWLASRTVSIYDPGSTTHVLRMMS